MKNDKPIIIEISNKVILKNTPKPFKEIIINKLRMANPKWIENKRMNRWNQGVPNVLKFYQLRKETEIIIPRGFLRQLIILCRNYDLKYDIKDQRLSFPAEKIKFNGELRNFQSGAVEKMLSKDFGILCAPTGSGKTVITLYMIAERKQPTLIIVHTKELAEQWKNSIEYFLSIDRKKVGLIGSGKRVIGDKVTVALVQTLYRCVDEIQSSIGFLVVDECHRCPSRTFTDAVTGFSSRFMLGLTATPVRRDRLSKLIFWHLGDVHYQIKKETLVKSGDILAAKVIYRKTEFKPYFDPINEYSKMLSELTCDKERNHLIASDIANEIQNMLQNNNICLVLSDRKKHCEDLRAILRYKYKIVAEVLTGDISNNKRKEIIKRISEGGIKVIIATGQLIGEGFDCKELSTLFLATPIRFSGRLVQYLGRVLRPSPGKKMARVFDYVDVHVKPLRASAQARQLVYQKKN